MTLGDMLALLPVVAEHRTGYDRGLFPLWMDADGDGCNTRKEVLIQEAIIAPTVGSSCSLTGGTWHSLYDGLTLTDASQVQIDHLVALAEAWDSGAWAWSTPRRELFANDLDVTWTLIAVSGASNEAKADKDPADWLPSEPDALCPFVSAWIAVKARWGLSVDQREQSALAGLIVRCPDVRMPLVRASTVESTPVPAPSGGCSPAYPTVCIPPPPPDLDCRDIPYRRFTVLPPDPHHFDGDHNGVGCETG
ncbi:MAG: HNH endonuclease family protein [Chloroflexota bacterium]